MYWPTGLYVLLINCDVSLVGKKVDNVIGVVVYGVVMVVMNQ